MKPGEYWWAKPPGAENPEPVKIEQASLLGEASRSGQLIFLQIGIDCPEAVEDSQWEFIEKIASLHFVETHFRSCREIVPE
jgi:hypothetical protein